MRRYISFPVDGLLDLSEFISSDAKQVYQGAKYQLCAAVVHLGSGGGGGHYVSYCRHHLSGTWHRYDDRNVTPVSADAVAKQEAYILMFKRVMDSGPSKLAMETIRVAQKPDGRIGRRYVSRRWLKKVNFLANFGPVDNRDLCCPHGVSELRPNDSRALSISQTGWQSLVQTYGGGPEIDGTPQTCQTCEWARRRIREKEQVSSVDKPADGLYCLISMKWTNQWRDFILHDGDLPGPVSNHLLFNQTGSAGAVNELKTGLQVNVDYRPVHQLVWRTLLNAYGGGPLICRRTEDIYGEEIDLETALREGRHGAEGQGAEDEESSEDEGANTTHTANTGEPQDMEVYIKLAIVCFLSLSLSLSLHIYNMMNIM